MIGPLQDLRSLLQRHARPWRPGRYCYCILSLFFDFPLFYKLMLYTDYTLYCLVCVFIYVFLFNRPAAACGSAD